MTDEPLETQSMLDELAWQRQRAALHGEWDEAARYAALLEAHAPPPDPAPPAGRDCPVGYPIKAKRATMRYHRAAPGMPACAPTSASRPRRRPRRAIAGRGADRRTITAAEGIERGLIDMHRLAVAWANNHQGRRGAHHACPDRRKEQSCPPQTPQ
jgi:hypothetical protein